ncbi:MAG: SH3 domain-containing protein [Limnochordales bacterium]|nr:SH3 domain-containing protein [Limnochordales bacterium]
MSNILALSLVVLLGLLNPSGSETPPVARPVHPLPASAQVIGQQVPVYAGPNGSRDTVGVVTAGTTLEVVAAADGWYQVRLATGRTGWIRERYLHLREPGSAPSTPATGDDPGVETPRIPFPERVIVATYYVWDRNNRLVLPTLSASAQKNVVLVPWSYRLEPSGALTLSLPPASLGQVLKTAGESGAQTWLLVHNFSGSRFDPQAAHKLLSSSRARARAILELRRAAANWGVHGIHLDIEAVPPADGELFTRFVAELAAALHADGRLLTLAVPAKKSDDRRSAWTGAYDYAALGQIADYITVMTYDEHYVDSAPGPVASLPWMEGIISYAVTRIPARKILLGVAGYGYDWPSSGRARSVSYSQVQALLHQTGITSGWDEKVKAPYLRYRENGKERIIWYQDRRATSLQLNLVGRYGLGGIALWRLGMEDPGIWAEIRQRLNR